MVLPKGKCCLKLISPELLSLFMWLHGLTYFKSTKYFPLSLYFTCVICWLGDFFFSFFFLVSNKMQKPQITKTAAHALG